MDNQLSEIRSYFEKLGVSTEIADLYFALHKHGPQTISQLARTAQVERTQIYRLLDAMQHSALITVETKYKSKVLRAAPITNLQIHFSKKEQALAQLQQELPRIEHILMGNKLSTPGTRIEFYHGSDGAKQMLWNETKAKGQVTAILYENIQVRTAEKFFARWVRRCNERQLHFRSVVSDEFIASQLYWYAHHSNERLEHWQGRYISQDNFPIQHSTIIYDDVTAFLSWTDDQIYGIEIHSPEIANTQRRFFEILWSRAVALPKEESA
jgi:sugar-specific transcriptional regulator TrmB